jgi:hypothetical protein
LQSLAESLKTILFGKTGSEHFQSEDPAMMIGVAAYGAISATSSLRSTAFAEVQVNS